MYNAGIELGEDNMNCPECHSSKVWKYGFRPSRHGKIARFQCTNCGHVFNESAKGHGKSHKKAVK